MKQQITVTIEETKNEKTFWISRSIDGKHKESYRPTDAVTCLKDLASMFTGSQPERSPQNLEKWFD